MPTQAGPSHAATPQPLPRPPRRLPSPPSEDSDGGDEEWNEDPTPPTIHPFTGVPGMTVTPPNSILGFVQLFITYDLLHFLMRETNDYANYMRNERGLKQGYLWTGDCTVADIATYLGICMWMGIIHLPETRLYWAVNMTCGVHPIAQAMSRNKFDAINSYFHTFNRRAIPKGNRDKLIIVRPVLEFIRARCCSIYVPRKNLALDEGMLAWKGRLSIKVYNPQKPDKYGIKMYFLCESDTGYVLDFIVYSGESKTLREIVLELLERYLGKGYHVFMDNYYNSVSLADELYANATHCSGTLRLSRKGAPQVLKNLAGKKLKRGELVFRRRGNTFILCWQDVRLVTLITTAGDAATEPYVSRKRVRTQQGTTLREVHMERPKLIKEYTRYMGGVDLFDQMIKYYEFVRRTAKWTKKMVFYLLQVGMLNAYSLYARFMVDANEEETKVLSLLYFQMYLADSFLYFNPEEWPSQGITIERAPDLPVDEREDPAPIVPAAAPPPAPAAAAPPAPAAAPPPAPAAATPDAGPSGVRTTPAAAPSTPADEPRSSIGQRIRDPPGRLTPGDHKRVNVGRPGQQKKCHVCYTSGKRKDTSYKCETCDVALCRENCFQRYHTQRKYWSTPASTTAPGRKKRRQQ